MGKGTLVAGKTLTDINDFHGSEANFHLPANGMISRATYNRVKREVCGNGDNCHCRGASRVLDAEGYLYNFSRPSSKSVEVIKR